MRGRNERKSPARLSVPFGRDNEMIVKETEPGGAPGFVVYSCVSTETTR